MNHKSLTAMIATTTMLGCVQVKSPIGGAGGGGGTRLSEIAMGLPDVAKITEKPEQQQKLTGYHFNITPKTAGGNCTTLDNTAAWANAKADAQILQGCDYTVTLELGTLVHTPITSTPPADSTPPAGTPPAAGTPPDAQTQPPQTTNGQTASLSAIYYKGSKDLLAAQFQGVPKVEMVLEIYLTEQGKQEGFPGDAISVASQGMSDVSVDVELPMSLAEAMKNLQEGNKEARVTGVVKFDAQTSVDSQIKGGSILPANSNERIYFTLLHSTQGTCAATTKKFIKAKRLTDLEIGQTKTKLTLMKKLCGIVAAGAKAEIYAIAVNESN